MSFFLTVELSEIMGVSEFVSLGRLDLSEKDRYLVSSRAVPESVRKCDDLVYIPGVHVVVSRAYLEEQIEAKSDSTIRDLLDDKSGKIGWVNPCHICRLS